MMGNSPTDYRILAALLNELANGANPQAAFVLNPGDAGLLRSLDRLSASAASFVPPGGTASIAAHVDHVRYGLELLNRWARGENPFEDANYSASWQRITVSDEAWSRLRADLHREIATWLDTLEHPEHAARNIGSGALSSDIELTGIVASVVHLAYHLGAIRQIDAATRGPRAKD
jgi:hypothetical protein